MKGQDELGFDVDPFEKAFGQLAGPVHWPSLTETERPRAFADLRDWVEQFVDRFAIEVRVIPPCWYRHNGMVEALSALRDHERMSFSEHGSPTGAVDWFRRSERLSYGSWTLRPEPNAPSKNTGQIRPETGGLTNMTDLASRSRAVGRTGTVNFLTALRCLQGQSCL